MEHSGHAMQRAPPRPPGWHGLPALGTSKEKPQVQIQTYATGSLSGGALLPRGEPAAEGLQFEGRQR